MRKARVLGGLVGGIVLLLGMLLLAVWLWVNPNNYKGSIIAAVKQATGRDLQLSGDLKLAVFPWVALQAGPGSLGNPPGFSAEPFVTFAHAALRVNPLALLRLRLQVSRIEMDGLDVRLRKNAQGQGNWQDATTAPEAAARAGEGGRPQTLGAFPYVRIRNGCLSYQDLTLQHLNLETGAGAQHQEIPVSISFDAHGGVAGESIAVSAKFDFSAASTAEALQLAAVNLSGTLSRPVEGPAHWEFSAPMIAVNVAQQSAQAEAFAFSYAGAHLTGGFAATKISDDWSVAGAVNLAPLVLREFAARVGISIPTTKDPKAFAQLSGSTEFSYARKAWTLRNLRAHLDDTQWQGNMEYVAAEAPTLQFDLAADHIDVDRYVSSGPGTAGRPAQGPNPSGDPAMSLDVQGTLRAAAVSFSGMDFTDLRLSVASKDRVARFFPIAAQIDGGRYSGDITLDERGAVRIVSIDGHLTGVDLARLLARSSLKGRWSGRATLNLKGAARGGSTDALLKTLSGHVDADLTDGALEGIDLEYERNRAQALIDRAPAPQGDAKRTRFDAFRTSAEINNGLAETHDLIISSPALRVTGQGSANLSSKAINFQLLASILNAPAKSMVDIPLKVTGTYADPAVKADIDSLAKDQLKQKLKDILKKNGLQGLFGK